MKSTFSLVTFAAASIVVAASPARANGRYPAAGQVLLAPDDANLLVVRTTFGMVISHDHGTTWSWVCESAAGYGSSQEDPPLALTQGHALLVATDEGLAVSSDTGCAWALHPELGAPFVDLVLRQDSTRGAFAIAAPSGPPGDGGVATYANKLYETADDGAHWQLATATFDADVLLETVEIAKSDPKRVYVSGVRYGATTTTGVLYVSTDGGAHVTAHTFPLAYDDVAPYVAAVDPTNADRVYLRVEGADTTRLFVSDDGGKTVRDAYTTKGPMLGFAVSGDGTRVYLGGLDDGLLAAPRDTLAFVPVSTVPIQCLAARGSDVYACSTDQSGGFAVGVSTDLGSTFTSLLHVGCVAGPLACSASSAEAACVPGWPAVKATFSACTPNGITTSGIDAGPTPTRDGGTSPPAKGRTDGGEASDADGGAPSSAGNDTSSSGSSGGCTVAPANASALSAFGALAALSLFFRRARRQ